ncbi:MAG: hypothetical protein V7782_05770 [Psychromonas sp.]
MSNSLRAEQKYKHIKGRSETTQGQNKTASMLVSISHRFLLLFALITVIPLVTHNQWITGTLVNAILILSYQLLGIRRALFLAFIPSIAALTTGLLPLALVPIIPFIVTSNIILLLIFYWLENVNELLKITLAAFFKFAFLYISTHFITQFFLFDMQYSGVFILMSWHQFMTAAMGGIVALSINKGLSKNENIR